MDFNNRVYFSDKTIKALVKLQANLGDTIPTFMSAGKGLSILACQPKTSQGIEEEEEKAAPEKLTVSIWRLAEALQLEKGDVCTPPGDYEQLKNCISMYTLLNLVLWG